MLRADFTNRFKKDYKLAARRGLDLNLIDEVIRALINETPLGARFNDHLLIGQYNGRRECHLKPDWLLIYRIEEDLIVFERTGTHADLF